MTEWWSGDEEGELMEKEKKKEEKDHEPNYKFVYK